MLVKLKLLLLNGMYLLINPVFQIELYCLMQLSSETPTILQYAERSVFMNEVNTQNLWTFEMGTQEGIIIPIWIFVYFQHRIRQDSENFNNHTF